MEENADIIITDAYSALDIVEKKTGTYRVISILSPQQTYVGMGDMLGSEENFLEIGDFRKKMKEAAKENLYLEFDDIEPDKHLPFQMEDIKFPTQYDCVQALEFLFQGGLRLVHCRQGISRSTAIVLGYLLSQYKNYQEAIHHLFALRPSARPNKYIVNLMCQILNIEDRFSEISQYLKNSKRCKKPRK